MCGFGEHELFNQLPYHSLIMSINLQNTILWTNHMLLC